MEYLHNRYIETRYVPEGKEWPPNQPKYYVNLAVIHYQGNQTQEEVIFRTQQDKHTDLVIDKNLLNTSNEWQNFSNKFQVTREIIDLFATEPCLGETESNANSGHLPRSILIEGAPGIGKTILLKEIAYRWANGTILDNARIVFLIYLRDSRFQSVTTINELLQYFGCLEDNEIPAVVKRLKQSNGEGVVFLIDGLDEYPGALQNTFLTCLIDRKILPKCLFVITSRSFASITLHDKVERRIEILGFGNEEREKYISKYLKSSPKERDKLETYLKQHPMLNSLVYIPFHLSILLFLFQQGNLPETLTEMNESFILHTVYRHMEKHDVPTSCVVKLENFPKPVYDVIYKLSKLAFQSLLKSLLVFTFDEVKQICPEVSTTPGALNGFGLLQAVQHYPIKGAGTTVSFNFLHLTMQEFLAAWYISHCSVEKQVNLLKQSFMNTGSWNELGNSIARMWQMYVGIVGVNCDAWVQFTNEFNLSLVKFEDPLNYFYYLQCLLEGRSKDIEFASPVFRNNTIEISYVTLLPYHIALLCVFLSKSTEQWKCQNFCGNAMGDVGVKIFTNYLLTNKEILACIKALNLSVNCLTSQSGTAISSIIQEGTLETLNVSCNNLGENGMLGIAQALQVNSTLKVLFLSYNDIRTNGARSLATALLYNRTLEELHICNNKIMDDGVVAISECFKINDRKSTKPTCIKSLDVAANCVTSHSVTAINTIILEGALVRFDLSFNKLGESGAYEISKGLQANLTLQRLFLSGNAIGVGGTLSIAVALTHNHTLAVLDISYNEILDDGAMAIAECLKTNRSLKCLNVSHNNITEIGVTEIVEVMKVNPVLENLEVDETWIKIVKPYDKQLLYNETIGRCFQIETYSHDPGYTYDQYIALVRVWSDDGITYTHL